MQTQSEHKYILGYSVKTMEAVTKYVRPQYETFRKLVFFAFFNWFLEANLSKRIFNQ